MAISEPLATTWRVVSIPGLRLVSEANQREHWSDRHRRNKRQQAVVLPVLRSQLGPCPRHMPLRIRLVRIAPRLLDSDNLAGSFKHTQDALAAYYGIADRMFLGLVEYRQERGKPREYGLRIELEVLA